MPLLYWPVSGPVFLALYATALVALIGAVYVSRRLQDDGTPEIDLDELDCYDAALLNGGEELAVTVALANLGSAGALDLGDGQVREVAEAKGLDLHRSKKTDVDRLGVEAHPVERNVYEVATAAPVATAEALRAAGPSMPALQAAKTRLEALGLLWSDEDQSRLGRQWLWFVPLMVLGVIRLIVGISRGRPVLFLVLLLVATVVAMAVAARAVRTTFRGRQALEHLRVSSPLQQDWPELIPPGAIGAALALFGASLLWRADPPLAGALAVPPQSSRWGSGGDGGGCGGCGGGCGGCGGCGG